MALLFGALWRFRLPAQPALRLCGFHWLTGRPCPFCGLTRAMFELAKGHWAAALGLNALSPLAMLMLFSLFWNIPARARLWTFGLAAFAIYGVGRIVFPALAGSGPL
jgi:hypothetical protein